MRSEPFFPAGGTSAGEPIRSGAGLARRIGARLLHEVREAVPPTIFFFAASILSC
jgi:hypothetical protein